MDSGYGFSSHSDEDYTDSCRTRKPKRKRRKTTYQRRTKKEPVEAPVEESTAHPFSINALLDALPEQRAPEWDDSSDMRDSFEEILTPLLSDLLETERLFPYGNQVTNEGTSPPLRLLSMQEASKVHNDLKDDNGPSSQVRFLLAAKARLHSNILRRVILNRIPSYLQPGPLTPLHIKRTPTMVNPQVLDALYAIETTRYENSFLSRIQGFQPCRQSGVIDVDWETQTPWINLMTDIREHYSLSHPERDQAEEVLAPIIYCTLQRCHLDQVHDLLARAFWVGINVSDSLDHNPEKCTIVATYKQLVVGAAFLSSPQEGYITYFAVRSGWDNSQIATSVLYHLITLNPYKDITLHVSINNPAMVRLACTLHPRDYPKLTTTFPCSHPIQLLYNRFGFKAEEFIVGFYEDYLDPNSPQSKNAFRLRLRR